MKSLIETPAFFLWSQVIFMWAVAAYGVCADPLPEDVASKKFLWMKWTTAWIARTAILVGATVFISGSAILSAWILLVALVQPFLRSKMPARRTAEIEAAIVFINLVGTLILIRYFQLTPQRGIRIALTAEQISAMCITATTMLFVVRGGTYIVRGCLDKSEALPHKQSSAAMKNTVTVESDAAEIDSSGRTIAISKIETVSQEVLAENNERYDIEEVKRGRIIGNLERLLLTLVVAAGSYAALAFLIAAKGLIRSQELQERDFAEYFLIGSLSSVLVSLCAGIALRFAILALWPALLSLQMQSS
jgi:hypothetical protein